MKAPFQPSNVVFAQFPPLADAPHKRSRAERNEALAQRALESLANWWSERDTSVA